ncbi:MAG: hypothetical protein AVDCRST_MAG79-2917 [uncultured Thermoleophilia bacterium]|uniref:Uncharacterized protein n=1 Tax=uncultured Thermoleophilia bacterium TaxID=1497501 RepID=A0A6J4UQN9_9ACTN|nr:MAG: hypothetical protein AVDCRST_MAG79-2917 [uncultured Thermoleophilia bacterium]
MGHRVDRVGPPVQADEDEAPVRRGRPDRRRQHGARAIPHVDELVPDVERIDVRAPPVGHRPEALDDRAVLAAERAAVDALDERGHRRRPRRQAEVLASDLERLPRGSVGRQEPRGVVRRHRVLPDSTGDPHRQRDDEPHQQRAPRVRGGPAGGAAQHGVPSPSYRRARCEFTRSGARRPRPASSRSRGVRF